MSEQGETVLQPGVQIRPQMTYEDVRDLAQRLYHLTDITITEFNAYDDRNYHIQVPDTGDDHGHGYVLKVTNSLDSKKLQFMEGQNEMMLYLDKHEIKCPTPVKNVKGTFYSVEKLYNRDKASTTCSEHVVRLLTYIPGTILFKVPCTNELYYKVGKCIAEIDETLKGFQHPAYDSRKSLWTLEAVPELRKFVFAVEDKSRRELAYQIIEQFEAKVAPLISSLEKGVLHGDFNEQNILVQEDEDGSWEICAVLDYGDSHKSCYVFELAITMCYMMTICKDGDVIDAGGHVLAGYTAVRPVPEKEFRLLKTCVSSRLCQSVVLGAYSHLQDPGNEYVLTSQEAGWRLLFQLAATTSMDVERRWRKTLASYHS